MRSRYDLMKKSTTQNSEGTYYKDIFTMPLLKFQYTQSFETVTLTQKDVERPDIFIRNIYGFSEFDDIIFWINNVGFIFDKNAGDEIEVSTRSDLENYYYKYRE